MMTRDAVTNVIFCYIIDDKQQQKDDDQYNNKKKDVKIIDKTEWHIHRAVIGLS